MSKVKISQKEMTSLQNKIILNILKYASSICPITNNNNVIKDYAKYISERCNLSEQRILNILTIEKTKRLTIKDVSNIAYALNVEIRELFKIDE